jgi:hypothetical protein
MNRMPEHFFMYAYAERVIGGVQPVLVHASSYDRMEAAVMMGVTTKRSGDPRSAGGERARGQLTTVAALALCAAAWAGAARAEEVPTQAAASQAAVSQEAPSPSGRTRQPAAAGTLDRRFKALSKALDLDARQQSELWKILDGQRQEVRKIWSNPALIPAERVPATRALQDRTADQIRAILTDEQKKRYNPPKPHGPQPDPPDVEAWMKAARSK